MGNNALHDLARQLRSRRIDRRHFLQGAAALGASATAISSALRVAPAARAQDAGKVVFWTTHTEPDLAGLQMIVDNFNQENPDVQAELVQVVGSETDTTKLMTAVRGGTGPDVYMLDRFIVAQRAAEGVLQELTEFIGDEDLSEVYVPFAWAEANFEGKPYALPFDTDARALFFNRGLFQEVGVDPAELDAANGPVTFDRITEISNMINQTDADGNFSRVGFVPWIEQGWHYTYGFAFGGTFFDEASCQVTPDNAGVVAGHQYLYDYAEALDAGKLNNFASPFVVGKSPAPAEETHPFVTQRVAMVITGDWYFNTMAKFAPDVDYGVTLIPVPNAGDQSATWAGGWSAVIPQGAKNPEGAWQFLQYFAGEPGQRTYTTETLHLPVINSLLQDKSLYDERHLFFAETLLPTAKNRPPLPVGAKYWDELTTAQQKVYLNEETPEEALATAKERTQPDLDRFCPIESS
jgi:multiple sugar transport system substrate-binding protein